MLDELAFPLYPINKESIMQVVNLKNEGFPNYELYSNGVIKNLMTGKSYPWRRNAQLFYNGTCRNVCTPILLRRYFGSELDTIPKEERKSLEFMGYPDYEVTIEGKIWSHKTEAWKELHGVNSTGYMTVALSNDQGQKSFKLHRIVAMAFVPNPYGYDQIDHIDGVKIHNEARNLEWVNGVENIKRARLKGLKKMILTEKEIRRACELIQDGYSDAKIAAVCNTSAVNIYHIRTGHTHCDISSEYGIEEHRIRGRKIDWSKYKKHHSKYKTYVPKQDQPELPGN